jgi:uncharacterized protein YodC (DUF2158 family)
MSGNDPKSGSFPIRNLRLIATSESFLDRLGPELVIGDYVTVNSGGPTMTVVDIDERGNLVTAWRGDDGKIAEHAWPRRCLHRMRS